MPKQILLLLSSMGAIQSLFLSLFIFSTQRPKKTQHILLALLFLALGLRVGKSVLWAFSASAPLWSLNVGFAAHIATAPLLFLYCLAYLTPQKKFSKWHFLHFLPSLGVLGLVYELALDTFWYRGGYASLLYYHLFYMLFTLVWLFLRFQKQTLEERKSCDWSWLRNLWLGLTLWNFAYFSNYVLGLTSYLLGAVLYSVIVYVLSFQGFRQQGIFSKKQVEKKKQKQKKLRLDSQDVAQTKGKLLALMEKEQPYLEHDCSLSSLAKKLSVPAYVLSHIINQELKQNFSEFANSYRIRAAQQMLQDPKNQNLKIASIAYDCGFNSLSSFNTAFKKMTKMTPSAFRSSVI